MLLKGVMNVYSKITTRKKISLNKHLEQAQYVCGGNILRGHGAFGRSHGQKDSLLNALTEVKKQLWKEFEHSLGNCMPMGREQRHALFYL